MGLRVALSFLTSLPLPAREVKPEAMGRAAGYFPLVGLLVGGVLVALDASLRLLWPGPLVDAMLLLALVLITGGLHLDGLMDSCDGLFGRRDPAQRLAIMRDSRVGSFGVLGAVACLLLKYAALGALAGPWRLSGLLWMTTFSRWSVVLAIWTFPYGRSRGLGRAFKDGVGRRQVAVATLAAAAVAALPRRPEGIVVLLVAAGVAWLVGRFIVGRIPGLTGDSYGAIVEIAEVAVLLAVVALMEVSSGG